MIVCCLLTFFLFFYFYLFFALVGPSSCDFDRSMCGFVQDKSDKFDWTRHSGTTSSPNTGPSSDHTGKSGRLLKENFLPVQYPICVLFIFLPPILGNVSYLKSFSKSRTEIV